MTINPFCSSMICRRLLNFRFYPLYKYLYIYLSIPPHTFLPFLSNSFIYSLLLCLTNRFIDFSCLRFKLLIKHNTYPPSTIAVISPSILSLSAWITVLCDLCTTILSLISFILYIYITIFLPSYLLFLPLDTSNDTSPLTSSLIHIGISIFIYKYK